MCGDCVPVGMRMGERAAVKSWRRAVAAWGAVVLLAVCPLGAQEGSSAAGSREAWDDESVETLTAGPIHEAFASPAVLDPLPSPIVPKEPPPDIVEEPPPYLPEGAVWIPGYWAWDDERDDFVWVSGVARVPPPSMRFVPGYWAKVEGGWQRVAGFWTREDEGELEYRPAPPASLESGPSSPAPGDDHFWVPGTWVYRPTGFVWQVGYWAPYQPDWIWVPARWVWTPAGCLYLPGYWDYRLGFRGQLFAPIWFRRPLYLRPGWVYRPWCVIPTNNLFVHLWVRPQFCHYYFGNYYGARYMSLGLIPWVNITIASQRTYVYDPFFTYCRVHYRRQGVDFVGRIQDWHRYYAQHEDLRPPRTWHEQQRQRDRTRSSEPATQLLAHRIEEVVRQSDQPLPWVALDPAARRQQLAHLEQLRELNQQRQAVEQEPSRQPSRPERGPAGPRTSRDAPRSGPLLGRPGGTTQAGQAVSPATPPADAGSSAASGPSPPVEAQPSKPLPATGLPAEPRAPEDPASPPGDAQDARPTLPSEDRPANVERRTPRESGPERNERPDRRPLPDPRSRPAPPQPAEHERPAQPALPAQPEQPARSQQPALPELPASQRPSPEAIDRSPEPPGKFPTPPVQPGRTEDAARRAPEDAARPTPPAVAEPPPAGKPSPPTTPSPLAEPSPPSGPSLPAAPSPSAEPSSPATQPTPAEVSPSRGPRLSLPRPTVASDRSPASTKPADQPAESAGPRQRVAPPPPGTRSGPTSPSNPAARPTPPTARSLPHQGIKPPSPGGANLPNPDVTANSPLTPEERVPTTSDTASPPTAPSLPTTASPSASPPGRSVPPGRPTAKGTTRSKEGGNLDLPAASVEESSPQASPRLRLSPPDSPGSEKASQETVPSVPANDRRLPSDRSQRPDNLPVPLQRTRLGRQTAPDTSAERAQAAESGKVDRLKAAPSSEAGSRPAARSDSLPRGERSTEGPSAGRPAVEPRPAVELPRTTPRPESAPRATPRAPLPSRPGSLEGSSDGVRTPGGAGPAPVAPNVRTLPARPPRASDSGASALERAGRGGRPELTPAGPAAVPRPSLLPSRGEVGPSRTPPTSRGQGGGRGKGS